MLKVLHRHAIYRSLVWFSCSGQHVLVPRLCRHTARQANRVGAPPQVAEGAADVLLRWDARAYRLRQVPYVASVCLHL